MMTKTDNNDKNTAYVLFVKTELEKIAEGFKFPQTVLAQKIGVSSSVISQMLQGTYPYNGTPTYAWDQVEKFIKLQSRKIYRTKTLRTIFKTLDRTFEERKLAVITAVSGAGKTTALEHYSLFNQEAVYIRVNEVLKVKYLLQLLLRSFAQPEYGSAYEMYDAVSEFLRKRPRLIILDEAERLTTSMLEMMRDLYDQGNMAMALVGLGDLTRLLVKGRSMKENLVQLYSRVDYKEIVNFLEPKDINMIFEDLLPGFKVTRTFEEKICKEYEKRGGIRAVIKIASLAAKLKEIKENADASYEDCIRTAIEDLDWRVA